MANDVPRVSIGMPAYNSARWIRMAVRSILRQSLSDFELIISDNASTDQTRQLCREMAAEDSRIRLVVNDRNLGLAENYNRVFRESRSPYFKWASSNDHCHPDMLLRCVNVLDARSDAALAYPLTMLFDQDPGQGKPYTDNLMLDEPDVVLRATRLFGELGLNNLMNGVIRRQLLEETALIRPYPGSDVVLMLELLLRGPFVEVPEYMFFRGMNVETCANLRSREDMLADWDPSFRRRMVLQLWRMQMGYYQAVAFSPLAMGKKRQLLVHLTRRLIWDRKMLWHDMLLSARGLMTRRSLGGRA